MTNNHDGVEVRGIRVLRGPNLYAYMPVLEVALAIGPYEDRPSNSLPGFVDRLITWLPSLCKHGCSLGRPGGFVERLRTGTYLPHIVEHVTLALQEQMGFDVSFGRARGTGEPGVYRVLIAYREEEPAHMGCSTRRGGCQSGRLGPIFQCLRGVSSVPGHERNENLRLAAVAELILQGHRVLPQAP